MNKHLFSALIALKADKARIEDTLRWMDCRHPEYEITNIRYYQVLDKIAAVKAELAAN